MTAKNSKNRGFASMSSSQQREIARKGGRAAHEKGTAHEFTSDEARNAGKKGGERVSANRQHMSEIGRLGGRRSASRRAARRSDGLQQPALPIESVNEQSADDSPAMAEEVGSLT
jgi:general stress protein YciG